MQDIQHEDFNWFVENNADFFNKYGDCYIAIKAKTILGVYDSYATAVKTTQSTIPLGEFIVQHCPRDKSGYTVYINSSS